MGAFLAGFIEGEGSFGIAKQTRGYGYRPTFNLVARVDDADLVRALHAATNVGRITHKPAYRTSHPQVVWSVTAKSDCRRLVELIDAFPFHGRTQAAYRPWRTCVLRWVGDDATRRLTPADWAEFPKWRAEVQLANKYDPMRSAADPKPLPTADGWQAYVAGLITAEGNFTVDPNGRVRFQMHMRADEIPLLQNLRDATELGRVYGPYERSGRARNPSVVWVVFSDADTLALVDLLEEHAPGGRKLLEFLVWRHAVIERSHGRGWSRERVSRVRRCLSDARAFRQPAVRAS